MRWFSSGRPVGSSVVQFRSIVLHSVLVTVLVLSARIQSSSGACTFKKQWQGRWFQSGIPHLLKINSSFIDTKGECYEENADKYLLYDRQEDCYRCMAIHVKHSSVLQYKETFCENKASIEVICYGITGDAPLYSMFRKVPETKPIPCPFKSAPFTFTYNRGSGDCNNPPSKAESCTDDSRLVLKYQACPDIPSTESNIEELICLATWKEGSTRYLIGKVAQGGRRAVTSDEDQYRCFIYQRGNENGKTTYNIAQSGDATCNGVQNAFEGSRTMKLTTVDNHHNKCKFPVWITEHHTWLSLDHHKTYKFSQRNATLKIVDEEPKAPVKTTEAPFLLEEFGLKSEDQRKNAEMRVVCHGILSLDHKQVQIVAHVTSGCDSGYICMVFHKRDVNIIEIQQSEHFVENPDDACAHAYFDQASAPYTTLITTNLHSKKCPHLGKYTLALEGRKKRQVTEVSGVSFDDCISHDYEALASGCGGSNEMEFKSACSASSYSCHGNWEENGVSYVIASPVNRKSTDALRYCFVYTVTSQPQSDVVEGSLGKDGPPVLRLSALSESCHRHIVPGAGGDFAFNFTSNGTCAQEDEASSTRMVLPTVILVICSLAAALAIR